MTIARDTYSADSGQHDIADTVGYLLGVPQEYINEETYTQLQKAKPARVIRNLCTLRSDLIRNGGLICNAMKLDKTKSLLGQKDYISEEAQKQLAADHINWHRGSVRHIAECVISLNNEISNRINNCKDLFPVWLRWDFIKALFIMPGGTTKKGVDTAVTLFLENKRLYPYQTWLNWRAEDVGNILFDDQKFVSTLYAQNNFTFNSASRVSDMGSFVKDKIYEFIGTGKKVVMAVDCENADPLKVCAAVKSLPAKYAEKISKIILFDDDQTSPVWRKIKNFLDIPVEHIAVERIVRFKSLVDTTLTATVSKEHYLNSVDAFILVSSDSDYWGLISTLTDAKFLVMVERKNCSEDMKAVLKQSKVYHCYIDDFYTGDVDDIKYRIILQSVEKALESVTIDLSEILNRAVSDNFIDASGTERRQLFDTYLRKASLTIDDAGVAHISI